MTANHASSLKLNGSGAGEIVGGLAFDRSHQRNDDLLQLVGVLRVHDKLVRRRQLLTLGTLQQNCDLWMHQRSGTPQKTKKPTIASECGANAWIEVLQKVVRHLAFRQTSDVEYFL